MKKWLIAVSLFLSTLTAGGVEASVTDEVRQTVDQVVRIISDTELKKPQNSQKRRRELKSAIGRIFDYGEMGKRAMAQNWKSLAPEQQKTFVDLFATLLENTYAGKIESYNKEKVVYLRENVEGDHAEVKSKVISAKGDEYTLDYRLLQAGGRWVVYDVVIEGVSLVANYRSQFAPIMRKEGYDGLIKKLRAKNERKS